MSIASFHIDGLVFTRHMSAFAGVYGCVSSEEEYGSNGKTEKYVPKLKVELISYDEVMFMIFSKIQSC